MTERRRPVEGLQERSERYRPLILKELREVVGDDPSGLFAWMRYHLGWEDFEGVPVDGSRGKLLRPTALLLAAELNGADIERVVPAAAAVELVHNFSLLHDDVEDASHRRHGRATLWTLAGTPQAINTGDGMYTVARLALYRLLDRGIPSTRVVEAMRVLDEACLELVQGQYLDMRFEERSDVTREEYLAMSAGKSAAMFAAPFAMGALLAGAPPEMVAAFRQYGRSTGLAFQAVDDILGIWGDEELTGKPVGDDLRLRKMTYPVIAALEASGDDELREAYQTPASSDRAIEGLSALIDRLGGRDATERFADEQVALGLEALRVAGVGDESLGVLGEFAGAATVRSS